MLSFGRILLISLIGLLLPFGLKGQCSPDVVPPTAVCQNAIVYLDSLGGVSLALSQIDGGSFDNCILNSVSLSEDSLSCIHIGNTQVSLYAVDNSGNSDSCTATITVLDSILPRAGCRDVTVQIGVNRSYAPSILDVDSGSFDNCPFASQIISPTLLGCSNLGSNTITYTVEDMAGNLDSCTSVLTLVDTLGLADLPVNLGPDTLICDGDLYLILADSGYVSYLWSTGANSQNIFVSTTDTYAVWVSDNMGCTGFDEVFIAVDTVAAPNINPQETPFLCLNDTLDLFSDPGFTSYSWSTGSNNQNITITQGGWYFLTVTDGQSCQRSDSIFISQINQPGPNPVITPGPLGFLCSGDTLLLDAGPGYFAYKWSTGWTGRYLPVLATGSYNVIAYNGFGCWGASDSVHVSPRNGPVPVITLSGDSLKTSTYASYQWFLNGNSLLGATSQFYIPHSNGIYKVEVSDVFGCKGSSDTLWVLTETAIANQGVPSIYPNPSRGLLWIEWPQVLPGMAALKVFDKLGNLKVQQKVKPGERNVLDLRELPSSLYLIEVLRGEERSFHKVLIQR